LAKHGIPRILVGYWWKILIAVCVVEQRKNGGSESRNGWQRSAAFTPIQLNHATAVRKFRRFSRPEAEAGYSRMALR
jgi:hypothetical protein